MAKRFYFGCVKEAGHYMFTPSLRHDWHVTTPWGSSPDGSLCPHSPACRWPQSGHCNHAQVEGVAALHHKDGWTALSFWDRSVDKRGNCNSNFLFEGDHDFAEMLKLANESFPSIMARFTFPIVEHGVGAGAEVKP